MANLKDIAQKLGVSVSTVSRGLNGGKEISREMTEKILKAADELGYTLQGRGGRATPDWNSAGIIVPEVASEYYARLVHKAKDFLAAKGYSLIMKLTDFKAEVDALMEKGEGKEAALIRVIRKYIKICKPIRFDGNGYSDEWKAEAERRGLDCETSCPVIFDNYLSADSIAMFGSTGVMTQVELEARNEVKWETYTKKIQIEARVLGDLAMNHIVPVAIEYQSKLIDNVYKMKGLFSAEEAGRLSAENLAIIREISERTAYIKEHVDAMVEARKVANKIEGERAKAVAYHDTIAPMLEQIRYHIDKLELIVDDQMWTLPKYRELLFIR